MNHHILIPSIVYIISIIINFVIVILLYRREFKGTSRTIYEFIEDIGPVTIWLYLAPGFNTIMVFALILSLILYPIWIRIKKISSS